MQDTILPGYTPTTVNPVVKSRPWYRKPLGIAALAVAGIITLLVIVGVAVGHNGPTPSSVLKSDGYSVSQTLDQNGVNAAIGADGGSATVLKGMVSGAAIGMNGSNEEGVLALTPKGQEVLGTLAPYLNGNMGQGVTAHTADGGKFLVIDGPAASIGTGANGSLF
jgi:hypothetical protein